MTFLAPWLLSALALVPLLWWLLRVMPPRPKTIRLPTFFLLKDIDTPAQTAARTPWWLLLIRALLVVCVILALADPVRRLPQSVPGGKGEVLVVIDNGWAAATHWQARMAKLAEYLQRLSREGRAVIFLPTAPSAEDGKIRAQGPLAAAEAEKSLSRLMPQPWPSDRPETVAAVETLLRDHKISHTIFLSDGLQTGEALLSALQNTGGVTLVRDSKVNRPYVLRRADSRAGGLGFQVEGLTAAGEKLTLTAFLAEGDVLDERSFESSGSMTAVDWDVPEKMRNKVARVVLRGAESAAAVYLTDSRFQQHPAGIIADAARGSSDGVLGEVYYLRRALEAGGEVSIDTAEALLEKSLSVIVWADSAAPTAVERAKLLAWVEQGGFLIRFAGPALAANPDDALLPVPLRYGGRGAQGAITWEKPLRLGAAEEDGPFAELEIPKDVTVERQVLAEPSPEVFEKTWLQLEDGTPLVTGAARGKGAIVLVHTTAGPDWSDFCYSGLYVEVLQRMAALGAGVGEYKAQSALAPVSVLDAFGRLHLPDSKSIVTPLAPDQVFSPSPRTPPGLYGAERYFQAFNLGDALPALKPLGDVSAMEETYDLSGEESLKAGFFKAAVWLLLLDTLATLFLRGVFSFARRTVVLLAMLMFLSAPAQAQHVEESDLVSGLYLAYVETGDQGIDRASHNGLMALKTVANARTNANVRGVRGVDPATDALFYYPFLYWPMTEAQGALSDTAARNLRDYMARGGMLLIDTRDRQFGGGDDAAALGARQLRKLTDNIRIPLLAPVEKGHLLTKSFYIIDGFPGLYDGGRLWAEKEPSPEHDGVTSVVIGGNAWASAWAEGAAAAPQQRELSLRFGVNLLMMALAGSYKADQVHMTYLLERMGK